MRVLRGLKDAGRLTGPAVVTIGVFDGVHVAHQQLVRATVRLAHRLNARSVVITFDPDPRQVLDPAHAPPALMPMAERLRRLQALGVEATVIVPFSKAFARTAPRAFIANVLAKRLHAAAVVVGDAFAFGRARTGDMAMLRRLGPSLGLRVLSVGPVMRGGQPVSSSRIRRLIASGQLAQARRLLGAPPRVYGVVVRGAGRGRSLGAPTANIAAGPQALPPQGVYAVRLHAGARTWPGVMNFGTRPTFGPGALVCEVHVLGRPGTLRGRAVSVSLCARLRGERCFPSRQALARQIRRDIARTRRLLATHPS